MTFKSGRWWQWTSGSHWSRRLFLTGALCLLGGLFCIWQAWLITRQDRARTAMHHTQQGLVKALAGSMAAQRAAVAAVLARADHELVSRHPAQAALWLRQRLPQLRQLTLYSADLSQVQSADYRKFGYARAAQLLGASRSADPALMHVRGHGARHWRLSLVMPVGPRHKPWAWAWMELPFGSLQRVMDAIPLDGTSVVLQQGSGQYALPLLSRGVRHACQLATRTGLVPGSTMRVVVGRCRDFVTLPVPWWAVALLAAVLTGGGMALCLWSARIFNASKEKKALDRTGETIGKSGDTGVAGQGSGSAPGSCAAGVVQAPAQGLTLDRSIFRAYDVRGVVGKNLDCAVARALGQAISMVMREQGLRQIVAGRDGRLSGPQLLKALGEGLRGGGVDVIDIGAAPTPVVYYAAHHFNTGSCVAVTGSHNPPEYNGFKMVLGGQTLSEGAIDDLYQRMAGGALPGQGEGALSVVEVIPDYVQRIASDVQLDRPFKVVMDCGNGIAGATAPQVLESIGCQVIRLHCEVDGHFPHHHPDPSDPQNLQDLIHAVKQVDADLGVAFDGDGDRLGVVTRTGEIIYPDRLLMLFARDVLTRRPDATIIYDVKCTGHLKDEIQKAGGRPLMWRTGHSLIKARMVHSGAALAGEMSGHFFFKERWYGFDDGIYASARLVEILGRDARQRSPEAIFATLPKGVSTPELKIGMREGEHVRLVEKFRAQATFGADASLVTIDGVRADWPDGWGLVRASNTTPAIVLRFDADNAEALHRIQEVFRRQLLAVDANLKLPF